MSLTHNIESLLFFLYKEDLFFSFLENLQRNMSGLIDIDTEIQMRRRIGGNHFYHLAAINLHDRLFQAQ